MIASRTAALLVAGFAGLMALHLSRASAQWWHRAPSDYEDCTEAADKLATKEEKSAALGECSAKFAGRRKASGGYTYYDFMQDRNFDIAGPNPTPEEQKYIDEQYTGYLENQRRRNIAAAFAKKQQMQVEQASLKSDAPATARIPVPQERPKVLANQATGEAKPRCPRHTFSCEWPKLSESLGDLKKLFGAPSSKGKKSESRS